MELEEVCRFRSDFCHDLTLHKEFNRGSVEGNLFTRVLHLILSGILIWFLVQMAALDAMESYGRTLPKIAGIWLIVELLRWLPTRGGGTHFKRGLMLNGGKPTMDTVLFLDECIYTLEQNSGNKVKLEYAPIHVVYETDNLLLLGMKYNTFLIVDKRTLTGTREEFGAFLWEKCPKLRNKNLRNCRTGRYINYFKWAVILVSLLIALFCHPGLQLRQRLLGQIHNGMSTEKILTELEEFGIGKYQPGDLQNYDGVPWGILPVSKLESILERIGTDDHYRGTGVFLCYYWIDSPETMYTELLQGIADASHGELQIQNIREDHSNADWDAWEGTVSVSFDLNGQAQSFDAVFYGEWYDEQIFHELNAMIYDSTGKRLYFADYDDAGCFLFYGDDVWAERFSKRTGLTISSDINEIY